MITDFLTRHAQSLSSVKDRATLANWHAAFAKEWVANSDAFADSANDTFELTDNQIIKSDVGVLAVESANQGDAKQTWILLSANPGWSKEINPAERIVKGQDANPFDVAVYQSFRQQFFPRWYNECIAPVNARRAQWWNKALNFLHDCAGINRAAGMAQRAQWLDVIGWELWPMHSTSDGLSALARTPNHILAKFARASIDAALRFQTAGEPPIAGVVLASTIGFDLLATMVGADLQIEDERTIGTIRVRRYHHARSGQNLWAIRRQLFSGWGAVIGAVQQSIVQWVKGAAGTPANPVAQVAPPAIAALPPSDRLSDFVQEVMGVGCRCKSSNEECVDDWHTWTRKSNRRYARLMVRKPGKGDMIHLNIPKNLADTFKQELKNVVGARLVVDKRYTNFSRFGFKPDLDNDAHVQFLEYWLPRTRN